MRHFEDWLGASFCSEVFTEFNNTISEDDLGMLDQLRHLQNNFSKISEYSTVYSSLKERLSSVLLELEDIYQESSVEADKIEADPERLIQINNSIRLLEDLYRKHQVDTVDSLKDLRDELADKVFVSQGLDKKIKQQEKKLNDAELNLTKLGAKISKERSQYKTALTSHPFSVYL